MFALTAHVTFSVGWIGAVVDFLGLALIGLTSDDPQTVRGAYLVMEPAGRFVLIPMPFGSLLTGLIQSLGSAWGLFKRYWVIFKLAINLFATVMLLMYLETFRFMAGFASDPMPRIGVVRNVSPLLHAILALVLLLVATVLAIYKPRGLTPHGWREQRRNKRLSAD